MEQQKNKQFLSPVLYALVLIAGMYLGFRIAAVYYVGSPGFLASSNKTHLDYLIDLIQDKYVDSLDNATLYENGVEGIISSLDPHTVYIPPAETESVNEELEGSFYGIGIEFFLYEDTIHISSIVENSPAEKAAIKPGDLILKIDDSLVAGKELTDEEIVKKIKGTKNSLLTLTLLKPDGGSRKVSLERESVAFNSIVAAFKLNDEVGYMQIRLFTDNTFTEFKAALQKLLDAKIKKLVIDVRGNPGGYMEAATSILDELVGGKHVLLSTKNKVLTETVESHRDGLFEEGKIAILVDENSASASEILAGALQDLDRGVVIGRRSYGKGLVQEQFGLPNNGAIRITTARYYLPSGRCIQKDYSKGKNSYQEDLFNRYQHGEMMAADTSNKSAQQKFYTVDGRVVYGNEGIVPDVFVALDTLYDGLLDTVYGYNIIEQYAHKYFYLHNADFDSYKDAAQYFSNFRIDPLLNSAFMEFVHHKVRSIPFRLPAAIQQKIDLILTSEFAKLLFGKNARYQSLAREDRTIQEAVRYLSK